MKRLFWLCLIVLVLGLAGWFLSRAFIPVSAGAKVTRGNVVAIVTGSVTVSAEAESQILSPEDGIIKVSHLQEGQEVHAGEVLAELDPGELPFLRREAQVNLENVENRLGGDLPSEIQLKSQQKDLADDKVLLDAGFFAKGDYENLERAVQQQQTQARQDRDELKTQQAVYKNSLDNYDDQLKRLQIGAPYDGTITAVNAYQGDLLTKATPIAGIISRAIKIQAEVNQDDIAAVSPNEHANIRFFAYPDIIPATVKLVLPSSDKITQRFTVLLELTNPSDKLRAGLTGEVSFLAGEHDNVLRIPRRALYGTSSVVVVKDGRVDVRQIKAGYVTLTQAEILPSANPAETVSEGETVLTENLDGYRTGDRVDITTVDDNVDEKKP